MKTRAAVMFAKNEPWRVETIDLGEPAAGEVLVKVAYAGLCHSDEHVRMGDIAAPPEILAPMGADDMLPCIGGHEGAGVVEAVGPGVTSVSAGDHVAVSFVPACGHCFWCASGRQHLCDNSAYTLAGPMMSDRTWRHHFEGRTLNRMAQIGTFSERVVCHVSSLVRIDDDVPLDVASLVSCGIATGFGSAVSRGRCQPGEVVAVVGCGGVGSGALLGAVASGARAVVAVDPVDFKRESAQRIGATHTADSMAEALPLITDITRGRMADVVVLTPGLLLGSMISEALGLAGKDGRVVCTAMASVSQDEANFSLFEFAMFNKALLGCLFGSASPRNAIPALIEMYRAGKLPLDDLITRRYRLDEINSGYEDLHRGLNIRGVIDFT